MIAGNASLVARRDQLVAEIGEHEKQQAVQKQRDNLQGMSALEFLERIAKAGDAEKRLRILADNLAAVERVGSEKATP